MNVQLIRPDMVLNLLAADRSRTERRGWFARLIRR